MNNDKILIIDNYDSFTYNLVHQVEAITDHKVRVARNDEISLDEVEDYDIIILSPGPGLPKEAGLLKEIIDRFRYSKKIFGVCLGLQAIAEVFGGKLKNLDRVYHGIQHEIEVDVNNSLIFNGLDSPVLVGRYHSWVIDPDHIPPNFRITARDIQGHIMAIEHVSKAIYAVQFHPESIMTPLGDEMMRNFLNA